VAKEQVVDVRSSVAQALADYNAEQGTWVTDVERRLLTVRQNGWEVDEATLRSAYRLVAEGPR